MHFRYLPAVTQFNSFNGFHFEVCMCTARYNSRGKGEDVCFLLAFDQIRVMM